MADYHAIEAVTKGVILLLKSNYEPKDFDNNELEFKVFTAKNFPEGMTAGVSLFLYRIIINGANRTPGGMTGPDGKRNYTQLPVDLHFLLTAWGNDASLQHTIAGWMMRTLEDTPILPRVLLNASVTDVFRDDETVEINYVELATEDLLRLWEMTTQKEYQISVPYIARNVRIESSQLLKEGVSIQDRTFKYKNFDTK